MMVKVAQFASKAGVQNNGNTTVTKPSDTPQQLYTSYASICKSATGEGQEMAPTKKGKAKKAGKAKKKTVPDEEKYKKSELEVDTLKQYLEMVRKYQQLQRQADTRAQWLEDERKNLQEKLAACQEEMRQSQQDKARMLEEKDKAIAEMQRKIDEMETDYDKILHASLDHVLSKMQTTKLSWEKEATGIHLEYKDRLKEFGLRPLET
ncbi:coiled-coil domain-containing protein 153 isoform X2 [Sceloporus undulatus]|uniref:coiled-coil domain-containing protein 153 isoform X2 n=1 Tax=Sceloporus undulatus TaxID=8520 RepID=UPI001C4D031E|nr:coiled-coil domain-containing protein 153 isoform X2 [Sceloporus undulatus]